MPASSLGVRKLWARRTADIVWVVRAAGLPVLAGALLPVSGHHQHNDGHRKYGSITPPRPETYVQNGPPRGWDQLKHERQATDTKQCRQPWVSVFELLGRTRPRLTCASHFLDSVLSERHVAGTSISATSANDFVPPRKRDSSRESSHGLACRSRCNEYLPSALWPFSTQDLLYKHGQPVRIMSRRR